MWTKCFTHDDGIQALYETSGYNLFCILRLAELGSSFHRHINGLLYFNDKNAFKFALVHE